MLLCCHYQLHEYLMVTLGPVDFLASALNGGAALTCMELDGSVGSMMLKGKRFCDLDILDLREVQRSTYPTCGKSTSCKVKM